MSDDFHGAVYATLVTLVIYSFSGTNSIMLSDIRARNEHVRVEQGQREHKHDLAVIRLPVICSCS